MLKRTFILLLLLLILTIPVSANDGGLGRNGESVYPIEDNDVEMLSEDIVLTYIHEGPSKIDCTFVFHNTGEAKTVLMGFPAMVHYDEDDIMGDPETLRLKNFTAFRNGIEIEVNEVDGTTIDSDYTDFSSWYVFEVPFDAGETLTMTHTYDMHLGGTSNGDMMFSYVLETGRTWKNNIGHSKITFNISDINPYAVNALFSQFPSPPSFALSDLKYEDGKIIFEKQNFEPDFNITIWFNSFGKKDWWGIDEYRKEEEWESVRFFEAAENYSTEELIEAYNNLSYDDKIMETIYLNTVLNLPEDQYPPIALSIEYDENGEAFIIVRDENFDTKPEISFIVKNTAGIIIQEGELIYRQIFSDYGTVKYYARDLKPGHMYEITAHDYAGNSSTTILNSYGDFYSVISNIAEEPAIENPKTSEPLNLTFLIVTLLSTAAVLFKIKKRIRLD